MGLADAEVYLVGTEHRARTDRSGAFRLEVPLDGRYMVNIEHPRLDILGVEGLPPVEVELERGLSTSIELGIPSQRTLGALRCGREPGTAPEGILWGRVMEPGLGEPLSGVTVRLGPEGGAPGDIFEVVTDEEGRYYFCSVPPEARLEAVPVLFGLEGSARSIRVAEGAVVSLDLPLRIGAVGEVRGLVREGESGPPVSNATVLAIGEGERRSVTTDGEGRFVFDEVPAGGYEFIVSHLAFQQLETELQVEGGGRTTHITIRLLRDAIALDPVMVEVEARPSWGVLATVYDRRDQMERLGIGTFFDRTAIERAGTNRITSLVGRIPGARVVASRPGAMELRIHRTNDCHPALYVDGIRYLLDGIDGGGGGDGFVETIDDVVPLSLIEMIEVYRGSSQLPIEFASDRAARCGAVAVWTRRGH